MRMPNRILKGLCAALLSAGLLLLLAVVVWWFKRGEGVSFQDIVFWVGALPIVIFTLGSMGRFSGRGDAAYQQSRTVIDANPDQKTRALIDELGSLGKSGMNWILAGLLLWLGSWAISALGG